MAEHRGWIALDIDGTITDHTHHVPSDVVDYLHSLQKEGWELMFITGRTFSFAQRALSVFNFPHYLAIQNGADVLHMPEKHQILRHYLDQGVLPALEMAYEGQSEDFIVYAGYERGDFCYFRPKNFSAPLTAHLNLMKTLGSEPWKEVENFSTISQSEFPLIKCLGERSAMLAVNEALQAFPEVSATCIRDPLGEEIYLNLVTSSESTKGKALLHVIEKEGRRGTIIAAGDDLNDISMLEVADVKIVIDTAPKHMHAMATIVAKHGIIAALKEAVYGR